MRPTKIVSTMMPTSVARFTMNTASVTSMMPVAPVRTSRRHAENTFRAVPVKHNAGIAHLHPAPALAPAAERQLRAGRNAQGAQSGQHFPATANFPHADWRAFGHITQAQAFPHVLANRGGFLGFFGCRVHTAMVVHHFSPSRAVIPPGMTIPFIKR